ncbi:MAG: arylesterase [Gemmatimonadaceae bacterium]
MRFKKKGNGHAVRAFVVLAGLLASADLLVACSGDKQSKTSAVVAAKSTGSDTSAATGHSATKDATNGSPRARVVILGTSLTAGLGLDLSDAYPTLLQNMADSLKLHVNIVNAGLSGETSAGALRRADWVLEQPAAAVVLEVGANDGLRGVNPDSTQANIEALIAAIRKKTPQPEVLLVQMEAPPNFGADYTARFHRAYAAAARSQKIELLPFLLDSVAGITSLNQGDGIHPNKVGEKIVARNMFKALLPLLTRLSKTE